MISYGQLIYNNIIIVVIIIIIIQNINIITIIYKTHISHQVTFICVALLAGNYYYFLFFYFCRNHDTFFPIYFDK